MGKLNTHSPIYSYIAWKNDKIDLILDTHSTEFTW